MTELLSTVQEVLQAEDPEGLLELGAPTDEYSEEAKQIASELRRFGADELTEERVAGVVRDVWVKAFGPFSEEDIRKRLPAFRQAASRIVSHGPAT